MNGIVVNNNIRFKIKIFPRIHLSLIFMNKDGYRVNGGGGFAINEPSLTIEFSKSTYSKVIDCRTERVDKTESQNFTHFLEQIIQLENLEHHANIRINDSDFSNHIGLGSGTALKLALVEGIFLLNERTISRDKIILLSGRGGTSGVGINTYFDGGFSFDLGRKNIKHEILLPSSANEYKYSKPLQLIKGTLPKWQIALGVFPNKTSISGNKEINFFKNSRISNKSIQELVYEFIAGIIPSLMEDDYDTFCESIKIIQRSEWKQKERTIFAHELLEIENLLYSKGVDAIAFSSLGPSILIFSKNIKELFCDKDLMKLNFKIISTSFRNSGREIIFC